MASSETSGIARRSVLAGPASATPAAPTAKGPTVLDHRRAHSHVAMAEGRKPVVPGQLARGQDAGRRVDRRGQLRPGGENLETALEAAGAALAR